MKPEEIARCVAAVRSLLASGREGYHEERALVALADLAEVHIDAIARVESKVRPGGVLDRSDLDHRDAARDAVARAVKR